MRLSLVCLFLTVLGVRAEEKPIPQEWEYADAMKKVAAKFTGKPGVVLHIGDSITYANPYSAWAKGGEGKSDADKAILKWLHTGEKNNLDGWHLASFDHPNGGRSYTACSGMRLDELLAGGKQKMPPLEKLLTQYSPQAVVLMIGTNDATGDRRPKDFIADFAKAVDVILANNTVPIVSTIPPHVNKFQTAKEYNEAIRILAKEKQLPLIDYEKEIVTRRPDEWNGTLMGEGDVHPSGDFRGTKVNSEPTAQNLKNSGYLLRGWLSVKKIAEVKTTVFDLLTSSKKPEETPKGKPVRLPVLRDTWISSVNGEEDGSNGGAGRLKLKSYQEFSLVDIDPTPLKGKKLHAAYLHVKLAGPERLGRVGISSLSAEFVEGKSTGYAKEAGASTFRHRQHPDTPWAYPGSDICAVMFGEGGSIWGNADASEPDDDGWHRIPVNLDVIRARTAGASHGFVLFDDTGSEWSREGEKVSFKHFPNRFIHSRESGPKNAPYFEVFVGENDLESAPAVENLKAFSSDEDLVGEKWIRWRLAKQHDDQFVSFDLLLDGKSVPRYLCSPPLRSKSVESVFQLRDMNLRAGQEVSLSVTAVAGNGSRGESKEIHFKVGSRVPKPFPGQSVAYSKVTGELPNLGKTPVAVIDELDKVDPVTGKIIPDQPADYLAANHLWNAKNNQITLQAAKAEIIAFQVAFRGPVNNLKPTLSFPTIPKADIRFSQYQSVESKAGPLPDPILPLNGFMSVPSSALRPKELYGSLHVEAWTPRDTKPGVHPGTLILATGEEKLEIPVSLTVWDFEMPDKLSFLPEMNGYGLPADEHGYYRLAHRHRTVVNIVPYSQRGEVSEGWAPSVIDGKLDFKEWDERFGPYFDGSAFKDLPRSGVPLECFYLPLHENWPLPINEHYNGSYWADEAFTKEYRAAFVSASRQFASHIDEKNWQTTLFQCFLNNKVDYKRNGWSRASSPWLLDEPAGFQDFWALKYFSDAMHEGRDLPGRLSPRNFVFRADISRPMWQRDSLNAGLDYNVVNGDWRRYRRMVLERQKANQKIIEYGSANDIESSNMQPVGWCIDAWRLGANGVLPWLAIGTADAWKKAEATCLIYPPRAGEKEPTPSIRLKAFRRGQQDVEYLCELARVTEQPPEEIGEQIPKELQLTAKKEGTGVSDEDAGVFKYSGLKPQDVWALRTRIGKVISDLNVKK
ncbi:GDSL-type esterase/lipase family protein [Zavarzinella formosa]|uniref:GDSL-type esterase/lipase family protein n=1 Tax=Zavarzinella formosa TaxID=360055 RepID=UPI0012FB2C56|nr:GDSL-type esterase/lipase family protein [Zavarzinella formosa]